MRRTRVLNLLTQQRLRVRSDCQCQYKFQRTLEEQASRPVLCSGKPILIYSPSPKNRIRIMEIIEKKKSQILNFRRKRIFSKYVGLIHLADLEFSNIFQKKKSFFSFISISLHFLFSLSSFLSSSSCLFSCLASSLSLFFILSLLSSCFFSLSLLVFYLLFSRSSLLLSSLFLCESVVSTKGVHRELTLNWSTWKLKVEGQESEVEDGKDGEECQVEVYQDNDDTMRMTHAMTCAQHLELESMSMWH